VSDPGAAANRERFDRTLVLVDEARAEILAFLSRVTQAQADRRPGPAEWSVGEIAHHLALWERGSMARVAELAGAAAPDERIPEDVLRRRPYRLEDSWNVAVTGKGTALPEFIPRPGLPLAELTAVLHQARAHTRLILTPYRDQDLAARIYLHHRLGPITLYERIAFVAYHDRKHLRQMERTMVRLHP